MKDSVCHQVVDGAAGCETGIQLKKGFRPESLSREMAIDEFPDFAVANLYEAARIAPAVPNQAFPEVENVQIKLPSMDCRRQPRTRFFTLAEREKFDPLDNFSVRCEPAGMPRLMWYPHPYEFVDEGSEILIRLEMYDLVRTIHMDQPVPPEDVVPTRLGYSIGHWEDNTLVVETTHIDWNYYDTRGTPQSDAAEVTERFTLSDDQSRIDYHITTVDPAVFTEPATIAGHWLALGEEIEPYDCEVY